MFVHIEIDGLGGDPLVAVGLGMRQGVEVFQAYLPLGSWPPENAFKKHKNGNFKI